MTRFPQISSIISFKKISVLANFRLLPLKLFMLFGIAVIFISCEAVQWGGIKISLEAPKESPSNDSIEIDSAPDKNTPPLPGRTFLYLGSRTRDEGSLIPIVEILPNGFLSTPADSYKERSKEFAEHYFGLGSQFTLFSDGSKIGTLTATHNKLNTDYCYSRPEVNGIVRLIPDAEEVEYFLALSREPTTNIDLQDYRPVIQTRALRQASIDMIIDVIPSVGATWPPSVLESRQDINFFRSQKDQAPTIVATFTRNGFLEINPAPEGMYSILLIGSNDDGLGYKPSYVDYRPADPEGKAAGRYLDHLDLNGDGVSEIVLEMMGEASKWISVVGKTGTSWNRMYTDLCGPFDPSQKKTS